MPQIASRLQEELRDRLQATKSEILNAKLETNSNLRNPNVPKLPPSANLRRDILGLAKGGFARFTRRLTGISTFEDGGEKYLYASATVNLFLISSNFGAFS